LAVELREARRGDELAVAELHVRSWQDAYRELMPAEFLAALDPRERAARYEFEGGDDTQKTLVAVDQGREGAFERIAGFVTFGASRDADAVGFGEIYALYVDPDRYQGGIGRMLMADARRRLREGGFEGAVLWVLRGNERAQRFYEREGWERDGAQRFEQPYGIVSDVIRFRRGLIPPPNEPPRCS
jgi:ribosomal protein S18 acetylase RimI-like enzyme